jgi:ribose/xylose/arabinose/galactoside ABC-type transport system permease subunit
MMRNTFASLSAGLGRLKSWEGLLLAILVVVVVNNAVQSPVYLSVENQVNLFQLFIERIIVALAMTFIIVNGEIDLSVASVMGWRPASRPGLRVGCTLEIGFLAGCWPG